MGKEDSELIKNASDCVDGAFIGAVGSIVGMVFDYAFTGGLIGTGLALISNPKKRMRRLLGSLVATASLASAYSIGRCNHSISEIYKVNVGDREGVAVKHLRDRTDYVFDKNGVGVRLEEAERERYEVMRENICSQIEQLRAEDKR